MNPVSRMQGALIIGMCLPPFASVPGQSAAEHEAHHPPAAAASAKQTPMPAPSAGMGGMMKTGLRLDAYPSLMNFPRLTPDERTRLDRDSEVRMLEGTSLMSAAMGRVVEASRRGDYTRMHGALSDLRAGLGRLEAGLAGKSALSDAQDPRDVAVNWLRTEMSISPAAHVASGSVALSPFHIALMVILASFAITLVTLHLAKLRRIEALAAQWKPPGGPGPTAVRGR